MIELKGIETLLYPALIAIGLALVGCLSLLFFRGGTSRQKVSHSVFRSLFILSALLLSFSFMPEPYRTLRNVAPTINEIWGGWLVASIFLIPVYPIIEIIAMWKTRATDKVKALAIDCLLAAVYLFLVLFFMIIGLGA